MGSTITIEMLTESQEGTIGNDWKYDLEAKIFKDGRIGKGSVSVPKHRLDSGTSQTPPGPPEPLVLPAGEPGDEISVDLQLDVAEVDLLQNDTGSVSTSHKVTGPGPGEPPVVVERELTVGLTEEPSGVGRALFKLTLRLTIANA